MDMKSGWSCLERIICEKVIMTIKPMSKEQIEYIKEQSEGILYTSGVVLWANKTVQGLLATIEEQDKRIEQNNILLKKFRTLAVLIKNEKSEAGEYENVKVAAGWIKEIDKSLDGG
jgi:hypothetical protein